METRPAYGARLAIAAVFALLFAMVVYDVVTSGVLSERDTQMVAWLHVHGSAALNTFMTWVSLSGGPAITCAYATALIAAYLARRRIAAALAVGSIVYGAALFNIGVKHVIQRGRPALEDPLMTLPTYSFPSGHAAASTVFGGLICILAWRSGFRGLRARIAIACAVAWIALVGISRVYLGLHYPSDVVAGTAEGLFWLMAWTIAVDRLGIDLRWPTHSSTVST
ncbi:MAG: phosphatase PAP2 family protein [Pseudomonadota bacterium]|nr:phosphatase PAP2 family protein [Pseudomonadota bacterium]